MQLGRFRIQVLANLSQADVQEENEAEEETDKVSPNVDCLVVALEKRAQGHLPRVVVNAVAVNYVFVVDKVFFRFGCWSNVWACPMRLRAFKFVVVLRICVEVCLVIVDC